jgi:hypothetical protein
MVAEVAAATIAFAELTAATTPHAAPSPHSAVILTKSESPSLPLDPPQPSPTSIVRLRDLWGTTKLAQLETESRREAKPVYVDLTQAPALGNPFAHRIHTLAYTSWPRLHDLFPVSFPGVKTSRDPLVIDIDREVLERRIGEYLDDSVSNSAMASDNPGSMEATGSFDPFHTRTTLISRGFRPWQVIPYTYRPFDQRWIYWEPTTNLLDRKREEFVSQITAKRHWLEVRQREASDTFCRGTITRKLSDQFGNGMSHFVPNAIFPEDSLYDAAHHENLNLSSEIRNLAHRRQFNEADLFHHAVATLHTPRYRTENAGALLGDWPRIPLPATAELLHHSATLGRRLADLLDPESSVNLAAEWSFLSALKRPQYTPTEEALKITAGWGSRGQGSTVMPGRGTLTQRDWTPEEREKLAILEAANSLTLHQSIALLGETCVDVYLNGETFWSAIPINVWNYTLGGYQVLKKWLSYRELSLLGRPLHEDESRYFAQVVRRIAAILLLGPALDASYQAILPTATGLPNKS